MVCLFVFTLLFLPKYCLVIYFCLFAFHTPLFHQNIVLLFSIFFVHVCSCLLRTTADMKFMHAPVCSCGDDHINSVSAAFASGNGADLEAIRTKADWDRLMFGRSTQVTDVHFRDGVEMHTTTKFAFSGPVCIYHCPTTPYYNPGMFAQRCVVGSACVEIITLIVFSLFANSWI